GQIYRSGWEFNQIVCLAKGGLRIGDILCRIYNVPLAILAAASYGGVDNQERGHLVFGQNLTMTTATLGDRVLVVDDLVDSGITLRESLVWLQSHSGGKIVDMRTAVLWHKADSVFTPDYAVQFLAQSPWIHQPFEPYEQMTIQALADHIEGDGSGG
ncbi:MAG: phosphoribosyltransferase, partial [Prochlorothrix sp.]